MDTSNAKVAGSSLASALAYIAGGFLGFCFIVFLVLTITDSETDKTAGIVLCICTFLMAYFFIDMGKSIKKTIERFKVYVALISDNHITSLEEIASNTGHSVNFVKMDIQKMINKKYFVDAYIDIETGKIVIRGLNIQPKPSKADKPAEKEIKAETERIKCHGCGAINYRLKGKAVNCEYCGSLLK
ncbi:MAG: hypothetical protein ACM3X7_10950 [Solirubrobacterales bacterium]